MPVIALAKATADSEAGVLLSIDPLEAKGNYNQELVAASFLLAAEGLLPSSKGVRIAVDGSGRPAARGPCAASGELVAGFWLWKAVDLAEEKALGNAARIQCRAQARLRFDHFSKPQSMAKPCRRNLLDRRTDSGTKCHANRRSSINGRSLLTSKLNSLQVQLPVEDIGFHFPSSWESS